MTAMFIRVERIVYKRPKFLTTGDKELATQDLIEQIKGHRVRDSGRGLKINSNGIKSTQTLFYIASHLPNQLQASLIFFYRNF